MGVVLFPCGDVPFVERDGLYVKPIRLQPRQSAVRDNGRVFLLNQPAIKKYPPKQRSKTADFTDIRLLTFAVKIPNIL